MESIKFCEDPFSIIRVVNILNANQASFKVVCENWQLFGYSLHFRRDEIIKLREKLDSGHLKIRDMPSAVLLRWRDYHKEWANLQVLYYGLIDAKVPDLAASVREEFLRGHEPGVVQMPPMRTPAPSRTSLLLPDEHGYTPLLRALCQCDSFASVQNMLDLGADVNTKTTNVAKLNAAHLVILSLGDGKLDPTYAISFLDLFVCKGFLLINDGDGAGHTPLHHAVQCKNVNEEILGWFWRNGADFNAITKLSRNTVLFQAIGKRCHVGIIRKILDLGGNSKHVNRCGDNALHVSARYAHDYAMEIFIEMLDVNAVNKEKSSPLHFLFWDKDLEYDHSLKVLLRKGAHFGVKNNKGYIPMVNWIKFAKGNLFPSLMRAKDLLPINPEIASATLTYIVVEMKSLQKFLPCSSPEDPNEFAQFIRFLAIDKNAKLLLKDECNCRWKLENWRKLDKCILTRKFSKQLGTISSKRWIGEVDLIKVEAGNLGELVLLTKCSIVTVSIEVVLACLLSCVEYKGFVEMCEMLQTFCKR